MRYILFVAASSVLVAVPALAQQGGLPALQAQVDALQAQNATQQQQIDNLYSLIFAADDGTAQALVGTWSGSVSSIEFDRAVRIPSPGAPPQFEQFFFVYPAGQPGGPTPSFGVVQPQNGAPMTVAVNPEMWLARSSPPEPLTFTIARDGMKLSGAVSREGQQIATLTGVVVSANFFLMRVLATASGPCASSNGRVVFQGTGSLSSDRTRLTFTGSAIDENCRHSVFRVGLTRN